MASNRQLESFEQILGRLPKGGAMAEMGDYLDRLVAALAGTVGSISVTQMVDGIIKSLIIGVLPASVLILHLLLHWRRRSKRRKNIGSTLKKNMEFIDSLVPYAKSKSALTALEKARTRQILEAIEVGLDS